MSCILNAAMENVKNERIIRRNLGQGYLSQRGGLMIDINETSDKITSKNKVIYTCY